MRNFEVVVERCVARYESDSANAARLFHGRGHFYPGYEDITVDLFPPCLVVGSFANDGLGVDSLADLLVTRLDVEGICVQERHGRRTQTRIANGVVPDRLLVKEDGLNFYVRPMRNQNVGLFLDMAPARRLVRERANGQRVLNLFSYTCAFSVAAIAGGARSVVNNDMSRSALEWGSENHRANNHDLRVINMLPHNLFKSWRKVRQLGPYEIVVIDPPTNQRGSFVAEKQYGQILKRIPEFTEPGGYVIACLNSPFLNTDFLPSQMARWCPQCTWLDYLPVSDDFPDSYPDRALKVALFRFQG